MADRCENCVWEEQSNPYDPVVKGYVLVTECQTCADARAALAAEIAEATKYDHIDMKALNGALLAEFSTDYNVLKYWAVIGGLLLDKQFAQLKGMVAGIAAEESVPQAKVDAFNAILLSYGIDMSEF